MGLHFQSALCIYIPVRAVPVRAVAVRKVPSCCTVRAVPVRAGSRYTSAVGGSGSGGSSSGVAVSLSAVRRFGSPTVRFGGSGSIRIHPVDMNYNEIRDKVMNIANQSVSMVTPAPMDIDAVRESHGEGGGGDWGWGPGPLS